MKEELLKKKIKEENEWRTLFDKTIKKISSSNLKHLKDIDEKDIELIKEFERIAEEQKNCRIAMAQKSIVNEKQLKLLDR